MNKAFLDYYIYPQYTWAKEISKIFKSGIIKNFENRNIIDAPCGQGVISYWLKKEHSQQDFFLYDIDDKMLDKAKRNIKNATINNQNIFDLRTEREDNIWLFINSLYCLPEGEKLINSISSQMQYVIAVFPYIEHKNYKAFYAANPDFKNPSQLGMDGTFSLFEQNGYKTILKKDLTYISYHLIKPSFVKKALKRALTLFDKIWSKNNPAYCLAVFEK